MERKQEQHQRGLRMRLVARARAEGRPVVGMMFEKMRMQYLPIIEGRTSIPSVRRPPPEEDV